MIQLTNILCTDLAAITRGRAFPASELASYLKSGIGWVPANQAITAFDEIADNAWGSSGDLRLMADAATEVKIDVVADMPPLHFLLGDITHLDGSPWDCCTRSFLKSALDDLESLTGLKMISAFEHEFTLDQPGHIKRPGFSLEAFRGGEPFGAIFMEALQQAGQEPEMFLPEFAANQFEVTCKPTDALAAADRAVIIKLIARDIAHRRGLECHFSPMVSENLGSNGVHIHFSFTDQAGTPVTYDPDGPGGMSKVTAQFAAGIVAHMPALCAVLAPGVVSYLRLKPHQWSSSHTCMGALNREATLRICPLPDLPHSNKAKQFNLEYRAADALANPYLALGMLIRAGLEGIKNSLACPVLVDKCPADYEAGELEAMGVRRLPETLPEALAALDRDETARGWFPKELLACYQSVKNSEIAAVSSLNEEQMIKKYLDVY